MTTLSVQTSSPSSPLHHSPLRNGGGAHLSSKVDAVSQEIFQCSNCEQLFQNEKNLYSHYWCMNEQMEMKQLAANSRVALSEQARSPAISHDELVSPSFDILYG